MRVLLIHSYYRYATGEETYIAALQKLLRENGHETYLYSKDNGDLKTLTGRIKAALGLFWNLRTDRELRQIAKEFCPDVAHIHNLYPCIGATAYATLGRLGVPVVQTIHNYRFMCPKGHLFRKGEVCELCINLKLPFWAVLYGCYHQSRIASLFYSLAFFYHQAIARSFDNIRLFIFPSKFTRDYYQKHLRIPDDKTAFLPNFVDLQHPEAPEKKGDYYLYAGRLSEEKGILQILDRFKENPADKLKVAGDGPLYNTVRRYSRYSNIEVLGHLPREKLLPLLSGAKGLVFNSLWYEVLPYVLLEAVALNVPVLSPRLSKDVELLKQNHGWLEAHFHLEKIISLYRSVLRKQ